MKIKVKDIKVGNRIRRDIGDLEDLKRSLKRHGLLNPISINPKGELIAGHRRLTAVQQLGWDEVEVKVINPKNELDFLEMEMEENIVRREFSQDELIEGLNRKKQLLKPNIFVRILKCLKRLFGLR